MQQTVQCTATYTAASWDPRFIYGLTDLRTDRNSMTMLVWRGRLEPRFLAIREGCIVKTKSFESK